MADLLLSALIPVVLRKAADSLFQRIGEMWGINDQRERLHNMLLEIQAVLPDAEHQGNSNVAVKSWLEKLKSAAYDADDLLDEFRYEELCQDAVRRGHKVSNVSAFFSLKSHPLLCYKMSEKLKKVVGRVDGLVVQMRSFGFVHGQSQQVANRIRTDSLVVESKVVGRDKDKDKIVRLLLEGCESDDLKAVPIVGMGGLGKTTLAQLVYNDPRVKQYFNLPLWVCVSDDFNIGHLIKSIIELVEKKCKLPIDNMELLQSKLRQVLSGKRYILVLDDVWNENVDEWERLRVILNCGDPGSVVIVTTRSGRVATIMGTVESYNLGCLGEEDSWRLFQKKAFSKGVKECQELVEIGRKMVQNCRGLPLSINTLGSLMSFKFDVREWLAVLEESKIWKQSPAKDGVLLVLKLSYDHLPSYMKQCFAYCAVYPKDYEMDKEKLIQFWMANGFIPSDGLCSFEMKGNDIFNELAWRSFFQEVRQVSWRWIEYPEYQTREGYCSETKCKMHDLMHDLAQSIMGAQCHSTLEVPAKLNHPMINVHHISLRTLPLDINKVIDCFPSIRSLISSSLYYGPNYVKKTGFLRSNSLRILELHVEPIWKTIFTPEKMKHLRYLEFSNYKITSLPEAISTLYLLQTLRLFYCNDLKKLPEGMRYMGSLRHLYIERCYNLRSMPEGLGQLNCLQILTTYIIGTNAGNGIRELNNLNNIHGQLHLYNIGKINNIVDAMEANLLAKQNLDDLALCWGMPKHPQRVDSNLPKSNGPEVMHCNHFEVLDALKPCNKLKVFKIKEYRGDKLPDWMTEYHMLENLIEMYIIECREWSEIPPVEKLPFLRILKLKHLDKLRHLCNIESISAEGGEDAQVAFPSLKYMKLSEMPELCSWCEGEVGNKSSLTFFKLETLKVHNCPQLTAIPIVPSLMRMSVKGNKNLSCFATGLTTLHDLSLESHDGTKSLSFQPWESLNELRLEKYNNIVPIGANEGEVSITTKCRSLFLIGSNIPSNTSLWFWKCFTFLDFLYIKDCNNLIYWPEEEFRSLNCLRDIHVIGCPNFLGSQLQSPVGRSTIEVLLPMLKYLNIRSCPNLVEIPKCSTSIQELYIYECPKLQCLPEWLGSMIALKGLDVTKCESLTSLPWSIGGLASLEILQIEECPKIRVLPEGMEELKALEMLRIEKCPKIRVLPEGLLPQLKNLNQLWIKGCPHLERHCRKYGKYRRLITEIQITKIGEERRSDILKDLAVLSFASCKITCSSARS
ncbi:disease resistance protein RGA2-like [Carex rostrata]